MNYYPIYLDITSRRCIVVGGGDVAERKVRRLIECGAHVVIIGKAVTPELEVMIREGRIDQIHDDYDEVYIHDAFLVIGATDRDEVNARISADARKRGIMINIVDDPDRCDFILPSLFQQGDLSIAISTGGKSPALAKKIREDMEGIYGPEYLTLLNVLGKLRERIMIRGRSSGENKQMFEFIVKSDILQYIKEKKWDHVKKIIHDTTGENIEVGE
jgi:precorrin-2 dehydrogenase / sirohydrochlorin ferrochelatase